MSAEAPHNINEETLFERSKVHISRISRENLESWAGQGREPIRDHYYVAASPDGINVVVAGGAGKHSVFIPSFGNTAAVAQRIDLG